MLTWPHLRQASADELASADAVVPPPPGRPAPMHRHRADHSAAARTPKFFPTSLVACSGLSPSHSPTAAWLRAGCARLPAVRLLSVP